MTQESRRHLETASSMGVRVVDAEASFARPDLVLDAILGYGHAGPIREGAARLVRWAMGRRVLSLDVPTGLELERELLFDPHIRAEATLTLALPKLGLKRFPHVVGDLYLADISVPRTLYRRIGIDVGRVFAEGPIARIRDDGASEGSGGGGGGDALP